MLKIRRSGARNMHYRNENLGDRESDKQSVNGQRLSGAGGTCAANANEKGDKASLIPHSRRPALPSLQIPPWSLDAALSSFAKTDGPSTSTYFKDPLS
ncbi:hypothetical protein HN51_048756 [Arachis hypogaea]